MNQISLSDLTNFNSAVPWGLWVGIYIWLVGISCGSFFFVMFGNLANIVYLKRITRLGIALAVSTLMAGLLSIQIDLGHIERFYKLFTSPNPSSVMDIMVWLYGGYFLVLAVLLLRLKIKGEVPKLFLSPAVIFALVLIVVESLLFAQPPGKAWHSLIFPLHFLISSLLSALAALTFVVGIIWAKAEKLELLKGLSKIMLPIIVLNLGAEVIDSLFHHNITHIDQILLFLGNLIAIALLLKHNVLTITFAGIIELVDTFLSKYNSLISAQLVEPFKGIGSSYIEGRLQFSYAPTAFEYMVSAGLILLAVALFYILYKVLPMTKET